MRWASSCHGTRFEWCSISVTTTLSPGPIRNRSAPGNVVALDSEYASRFSDSEMFLVKITSSRRGALMNAATLSRAASNSVVASEPRVCTARATLALCRE